MAAVGIAWMQGGDEGAWPVQEWEAGPNGPRPLGSVSRWRDRPDPAWVALLRHGTPNLAADRPAPKEDILEGMAWEAFLRGEARPLLHLGFIHLELRTRARWVALLGATDDSGTLHLPPYLEPLVPQWLRSLPSGWWEGLLATMDAEGQLLPSGPPPAYLSELPDLELKAFSLRHRPRGIPEQDCHPCGLDHWVVNPKVRAWARGAGPNAEALMGLQPMTLGLGGDPDPSVRALLDFRTPAELPEDWRRSLEADLKEERYPSLPPPLHHPTWDWLRVRWGGECPLPTPGYPAPPEFPGATCDPFQLMGVGWHQYHLQNPQTALWAFCLSWSQFRRLGAESWAKRAAHNASGTAYFWGDLQRSAAFRKVSGALKAPFDALQEIHDQILLGEFEKALDRVSKVEPHPRIDAQVAALRIHCLINLGAWEELGGMDPAAVPEELAALVAAIRSGAFDPLPPGLDEEGLLLWESVRARRSTFDVDLFWHSWDHCPNALMRLGTGLHVMETHPAMRIPERLVQLQELAHRCGSEVLRARLSRLWPSPPASEAPSPGALLRTNLDRHEGPAWILWGEAWEHRMGKGDLPPGILEDLLSRHSVLEPLAFGNWIWWGRNLSWAKAPVGWVLLGFPRDRVIEPPEWVDLLAPWVAALNVGPTPLPYVEGQALLTNGSEPMASFLRELDQVAPSRLPVLLQGPSGSGKELAAREVHLRSGRKGPLVSVNCSEFAPGVLESELFGHVKGAFTGAARDKVGAVESARNGTLFLDEVADLDPRLQSMLLRVIQEREIRRVGSDRPVQVDVRFVAATHRDLDLLVNEGRFRKDLLFRLQGARLHLPSLDERRHEIPWLLPRLIVQICREEQLAVPALSPGLAQALARRLWPGNFRELRHVLQRALLRAKGETLGTAHFPELDEPAALGKGWEEATRDFHRKLLLDTLKAHDFQVAEAARSLGLARPALYAAAKRLGLDLIAARRGAR